MSQVQVLEGWPVAGTHAAQQIGIGRARRSAKLREGVGVAPLRPQQRLRVMVGLCAAAHAEPLLFPSVSKRPSWTHTPELARRSVLPAIRNVNAETGSAIISGGRARPAGGDGKIFAAEADDPRAGGEQ